VVLNKAVHSGLYQATLSFNLQQLKKKDQSRNENQNLQEGLNVNEQENENTSTETLVTVTEELGRPFNFALAVVETTPNLFYGEPLEYRWILYAPLSKSEKEKNEFFVKVYRLKEFGEERDFFKDDGKLPTEKVAKLGTGALSAFDAIAKEKLPADLMKQYANQYFFLAIFMLYPEPNTNDEQTEQNQKMPRKALLMGTSAPFVYNHQRAGLQLEVMLQKVNKLVSSSEHKIYRDPSILKELHRRFDKEATSGVHRKGEVARIVVLRDPEAGEFTFNKNRQIVWENLQSTLVHDLKVPVNPINPDEIELELSEGKFGEGNYGMYFDDNETLLACGAHFLQVGCGEIHCPRKGDKLVVDDIIHLTFRLPDPSDVEKLYPEEINAKVSFTHFAVKVILQDGFCEMSRKPVPLVVTAVGMESLLTANELIEGLYHIPLLLNKFPKDLLNMDCILFTVEVLRITERTLKLPLDENNKSVRRKMAEWVAVDVVGPVAVCPRSKDDKRKNLCKNPTKCKLGKDLQVTSVLPEQYFDLHRLWKVNSWLRSHLCQVMLVLAIDPKTGSPYLPEGLSAEDCHRTSNIEVKFEKRKGIDTVDLEVTNETNESNEDNNQSNENNTNQSNQSNENNTNQSNQSNENTTNQSNQTNQTIDTNQTNQTNGPSKTNQTTEKKQTNQKLQIKMIKRYNESFETCGNSSVPVRLPLLDFGIQIDPLTRNTTEENRRGNENLPESTELNMLYNYY
jgi:hypothetical protein